MGRIEEALAKLQRAAGNAADNRARPVVGTVLDAPKKPAQHKYGGRSVELDFGALRAHGLLSPDSQDRRLREEYRAVKRPLLKNATPNDLLPVPRGNLLQVVSALPGEGKTFTSLNLCLSLAKEQDWTVVLVDGDCHSPRLSALLGVEREPGLMGVLRGTHGDFDSNVMPTNVPNLAILPAGKRDEDSAELLASAAMENLCAEISAADPQRLVVFDSPPLSMTSEAPAIARHVGQILFVICADKTPRRAVLSALGMLDAAKPIGLLLNQARHRHHSDVYGAHYGYGQEYGSATDA